MQSGRLAALSLHRRAGKGDACLTGKLIEDIAQRACRDVIALADTLDSAISRDTGNRQQADAYRGRQQRCTYGFTEQRVGRG